MEGLAQAGNGTAEFVKEGERMQPKVKYQVVRGAKQPLEFYYMPMNTITRSLITFLIHVR